MLIFMSTIIHHVAIIIALVIMIEPWWWYGMVTLTITIVISKFISSVHRCFSYGCILPNYEKGGEMRNWRNRQTEMAKVHPCLWISCTCFIFRSTVISPHGFSLYLLLISKVNHRFLTSRTIPPSPRVRFVHCTIIIKLFVTCHKCIYALTHRNANIVTWSFVYICCACTGLWPTKWWINYYYVYE